MKRPLSIEGKDYQRVWDADGIRVTACFEEDEATEIVRCVNAYAPLVAALRRIVAIHNELGNMEWPTETANELCHIAKAALKAAGEGAT